MSQVETNTSKGVSDSGKFSMKDSKFSGKFLSEGEGSNEVKLPWNRKPLTSHKNCKLFCPSPVVLEKKNYFGRPYHRRAVKVGTVGGTIGIEFRDFKKS